MDVLFVCTGNICRSPMAEGLLRHYLDPLADAVTIRSAGLVSEGQPASDGAVVVMAERQIDLTAHRSQRLTSELVRQADVVLGMARQHVRETVVLDRDAWTRSFTIKELVRRAGVIGPRRPGQPFAAWLEAVGDGRAMVDLLGQDAEDDVEDPIGMSIEFYRQTADELDALIRSTVVSIWDAANHDVHHGAGGTG